YFVPVSPNTSRNTQRSGVPPSISTVCVFPLTLMGNDMAPSQTRLMATSMLRRDASKYGQISCASFGERGQVRAPANEPRLRRSPPGHVHDSLGERLWGFLRQVVPDPSRDVPVLVWARKFAPVGARLQVRRAVGVTLHGDGGHGNYRSCRKLLFQRVEFGFAFCEAQPPAVVMDDNGNVVWIVEGRGAAIEGSVVELPVGRSELPNQLRKLAPVFFVTGTAALSGKIELVPPLQLGLRRQRYLAGFLAANEIAAYGDHGPAALRPERREDIGRAPSPIEASEDRPLDLECVQKVLEIGGERRRLTVPDCFVRKKSRRAIATQIRYDRAV